MNHLNNILVAHDFSDCSSQALDYGIELALETGAKLHFLHVEIFHEDQFLNMPSPKSKAEQLRENLREDINASIIRQGFDSTDIPGIQYSVLGDYSAVNAINIYCSEKDIDIVVMGTHGRRGMERLMKQSTQVHGTGRYFLGSVAEAVVRTAPCSVFTVREKSPLKSFKSYLKKIVVPVELLGQETEALQFAMDMAAFYEVQLEILHVVEEWEVSPHYEARNVLVFDQRNHEKIVLEKLKELIEKEKRAEVFVEFVVLKGDPATEILRHIQGRNDDIVILTANEVAGHWQEGKGSTIERIVRAAGCPVITVKRTTKTIKQEHDASDIEENSDRLPAI